MCMTSAIYDYAAQRIPLQQWTQPTFLEFQTIIAKLDELDRKLGQPDCVDPAKAAFMKQIEERLAKLESRIADRPTEGASP